MDPTENSMASFAVARSRRCPGNGSFLKYDPDAFFTCRSEFEKRAINSLLGSFPFMLRKIEDANWFVPIRYRNIASRILSSCPCRSSVTCETRGADWPNTKLAQRQAKTNP